MIKFFRKIRKKTLIESKFGKYFIYAIGEIVLVVIGILIALNINNWNEHRKEKIRAKDFLVNIRLDLQLDIQKISEYIVAIPTIVDSTKILLNDTELDSLTANSLFEKLPYTSFTYKIKNQTYEKIINSGITDFFSYNTIFNEINTYYTSDLNWYNEIKNWDNNEVIDNGEFWLDMGFEIDILSDISEVKDEIRFVQSETTRKKVFLEQVNLPHMRNLLKQDIIRKRIQNKVLVTTQQRANKIIEMIDAQLKKE